MKKNYFMLAAATMMFAACAETDLVNEVNMEEAPKAIEFDAFANKTTRAEIGTNNPLTNTTLKVWGWKTVEEENTNIFNGIGVKYDSEWTYMNVSDVKYWDQNAEYNFYAASPFADNVTINGDIDDCTIQITGVTGGAADAVATVDYLITRAISEESGANPTEVDFTLSHIMSKVTVQVKYSEELVASGATLTDLTMSGWNDSDGTFTQGKMVEITTTPDDPETEDVDESITTEVLKEWELTENDNTDGTYTFLTSGNKNLSTSSAEYVGSYLMVPQTISYTPADLTTSPATPESGGLKFIISYKIVRGVDDTTLQSQGNDPVDEIFTDQVGTLQMEQTWETNTHYVYTITIKPNAIEFGTATVNGWTTPATEGGTTIQ